MGWTKVELENQGPGIETSGSSHSSAAYKPMGFELSALASIFAHVKSDQYKFGTYFKGSVTERIIKRPSVVVLYISVICGYN